jgi:hypothetical protein
VKALSGDTGPGPLTAWARCRPWIEAARAAADPLNTMADIEGQIARGDAQFWPGDRAACVTQLIDYPTMRVLNLWLCGGDLRELRAMLPRIEAWARGQGCRAEYLAGRPAWGAVLSRHGFRAGHVTFEKEL